MSTYVSPNGVKFRCAANRRYYVGYSYVGPNNIRKVSIVKRTNDLKTARASVTKLGNSYSTAFIIDSTTNEEVM